MQATTVSSCRAKDPHTCPYHGAEIRMYEAQTAGDTKAYMKARLEMEAFRKIGKEEADGFLPTPETASAADLHNDWNHIIVDYPTESVLDSSWTEDGVPMPNDDGSDSDEYYETNQFSRYLITGNLAQRVLKKVGKTTGRVTVTEATIPYWLSDITADTDYTFKVEVDRETVWDSENKGVYISNDWRKPEGSFTLTNLGVLNEWLNA